MASLPRIITVDPSGNIKQQISAATDLMDRFVAQIDVPSANYALEEMEIQKGKINAVIAAWEAGDGMQGWALAGKLRLIDPNVAIILLGDYNDTALDEEMLEQSPFIYLKRPFDIPQFIRVLEAALDGKDMREALASKKSTTTTAAVEQDWGPVPTIDVAKAEVIIQGVVSDLNPISAMLSTRNGEVLVARGSTEHLDIDEMSQYVRKSVLSNLELRPLIGNNSQAMVFYDGDEYDIFVLSVGLHHFITIIFSGKDGVRQLGAVSRFGRRRAEDLIGLLGLNAWMLQQPIVVEAEQPEVVRKSKARSATQEIELVPELARAAIGGDIGGAKDEAEPESVMPHLEAIAEDDFDPDALFASDFDENAADDLFSLDVLEDMTVDEGKKGTLDWETATKLGLLGE
jgi:DNA-binding response OmpR family regulator